MACYYPMDAVKFYDGSVKVIGTLANGHHSRKWDYLDVREHLQVPCGKCIGCRLEFSRQWAIRCMKELETTKGQSWFITLTYDNEHLPKKRFIEENSGIDVGVGTLKPEDLSDFVKNLREAKRRRGEADIRFFGCGEYGEDFKRPHYHGIFFNLNLYDLVYKFSKEGHEYYTSPFIDSIWKKGLVVISDVNFECCAYVARYIMKKALGPNGFSYATENGLVDEFTRMSRRPGIGYEWYQKHKEELYKNDKMYLSNSNGSYVLQPAKYYDKLFDVEYPEVFEDIKESRKLKATRFNETLMSNTSISSIEYRGIKEREKQSKIKLLSRDFEKNGYCY